MKRYQTSSHAGDVSMLVTDLLRVDLPAFVDLFEEQQSCVFRFPGKQQKKSFFLTVLGEQLTPVNIWV